MLQINIVEISDEDSVKHITVFYKDLFGKPDVTAMRLDNIVCEQISEDNRDFLTQPFSIEENILGCEKFIFQKKKGC